MSITGNKSRNAQYQFTSASIFITADVQNKIKVNIWGGEFVQLDELLQEQGEKTMMLSFDPKAMMGISLVPKLNKRGPRSISQWSLA